MKRLAICLFVLAMLTGAAPDGAEEPDASAVRVATLVYGDGHTSICFASGFLDDVARRTSVRVHRELVPVALASDAVFEHPFAVMSGEGAFTLSEDEKKRLRRYLERGGFLVASAGCSNAAWAESFTSVITELFEGSRLAAIPKDHAIFRSLYTIERLRAKKPETPVTLYGLALQDRLAVVFAPAGLNDTANAGGGCCCCGGSELRNARQLNANLLVYALTH